MAGTHAKKGPSGAESLHGCPGKLALVDSLPAEQRRASGRAAQLGTAAHFLLEKCLTELRTPQFFEGRIIELLGDQEDGSMLRVGAKLPKEPSRVWFVVDDRMIEGVAIAYAYVIDRCQSLGLDPKGLQLESKTNPCPEREDTKGTADVTIDMWPTLLEVVDYKNGMGVVEHVGNPQLLAYLAGKAHDTFWSHDAYAVTVVQPHAFHDEGRVRTFNVPREELLAFVIKHRAAAELSDEAEDFFPGRQGAIRPDSGWAAQYLVAGEHCDWCDAAMICPAKRKWIQLKAKLDFDAEPPTEMPTVVGAEEAAAVLEWAPHVLAHIKAARSFLNQELRAGRPGGGAKLVRGRANREWQPELEPILDVLAAEGLITAGQKIDIGNLDEALVHAGFLNGNEVAQLYKAPERISGPAAEKLVASKKRAAFSKAFLIKPPGRLQVASASDPREAVVVNVADSFNADPYEDDDVESI